MDAEVNAVASPAGRRAFLHKVICVCSVGLLAGCTSVLPSARSPKVPRVGVLWYGPDLAPDLPHLAAFRKGLADLGYVEGQSLALEWRYAEQDLVRLAEMADELDRVGVDVLFTPGLLATRAAKHATTTIPIVGIYDDPVAMGLVDGLARPGGNVTGLAMVYIGLSGKRVEKFKEAAPDLSRIAVLWNPLVLDKGQVDLAETRSACLALGIEVQPFEVRAASELEGALKGLAEWHADGIITLLDAFTGSYQPQIISFAMDNRLPTICEGRGFVMRGGFMSYGPDPFALFEHAAAYVDRILKGANPASLPVEQPDRVELVINLQTAHAIGRTIPRQVLLEADQAIT